MVSWQSAYPQILTLFQFVSHSSYYIYRVNKKTQTQSISHYRFDHEQLFAWCGYELCGAPNNSSHVGELFIKRPPEKKVQLLSKYTNLNLQYSLIFIIVRVCWTGQLLKEKFEGCASMQQRWTNHAISINKPMNCRNQERASRTWLCWTSKHLKGQLDPPLVTWRFLDQRRSVGPPVSDVTFFWTNFAPKCTWLNWILAQRSQSRPCRP